MSKIAYTTGIIFLLGAQWATGQLSSGNPIIRHIRSADPSAHVWNDGRVWIYASHDQEDATDYSTMDGYHVFSSSDMVEWTDHGEILQSRDVSWGNPQGGFMFAPDAAFKNGTYYFYFPHLAADWRWRIGVATSNRPEGPFTDIGRYIEGTDNIDPACFVDDDGQAYLIWGGDHQPPKIARLKENMTELAEEPRVIAYGSDNFGEGPYMHKRNGIYYFSYTCHTCYPYQAYYAMGESPYGPFDYKGELNLAPPGAQDHHSMIEYHGQWYYFYHVGNYGSGGSLFRRNVCVDSLFFNGDGTMRIVVQTDTGVGQDSIGVTPGIITPGRIEAEDFFRQSGTDTMLTGDTVKLVTGIHDSDWLEFVLEVLGSETYTASVKVSNPSAGSRIYLLVDEILKDSVLVDMTGDTIEIPLFLYKGKHTLKLLFSHPDPGIPLMDVDWIDLYGEKTYYSVTASAGEGGSIYPEGTLYLVAGDSVEFIMDWGLYYRPDSLIIDGIHQAPSENITFPNISGNHTIEANFISCSGPAFNPVVQVNHVNYFSSTDITVTEGDDLLLLVEYNDPGELSWVAPVGTGRTGNTFQLDNIHHLWGGVYSAYLTDSMGCKCKLDFTLTVEPLDLDVYQAEEWIGRSGVIYDICNDTGGGLYLGSINNGDWSSYLINIDEPGIYDVIARIATDSDGGEIELSIGDSILGTVPVSGTISNGWQDWHTTFPVEIEFEKGSQELTLTYRGEGDSLFNLNWFDLIFKRSVPLNLHYTREVPPNELVCYPIGGGAGMGIQYYLAKPSDVRIMIFNTAGLHIRTLVANQAQPAGKQHIIWNGNNNEGLIVPEGIYLILLSADNERKVRRIFFTK